MALCEYGLKCGIYERRIRSGLYSFLQDWEETCVDGDEQCVGADVREELKERKDDKKII